MLDEAGFRIVLWGVRGSLPVAGARAGRYGGNTICIEMRLGPHCLFFDAGTGLPAAGADFAAAGRRQATLFLSHAHYDHMLGLPFFKPLWDDRVSLDIWSGHLAGRMTTAGIVEGFMREPYFPIGPSMFRARVGMRDFRPGEVIEPHPGLRVRSAALNHPGGAVGFRVEWAGRAVAVITDTEHDPGNPDPVVLSLAEGADLMLYDAAYDDAEFTRLCGFGHSTWQEGVRLARAAGVRRLGLIHHAEWRMPADLDRIGRQARTAFPRAFMGRDGQVIDLQRRGGANRG
ncbi:MAG: MBL fold metallo-hydrolase [Paracoccaceae bacterium]|nr:MAG: MBL fold metallo-hydrolase [Paracoccaceae bacterium]